MKIALVTAFPRDPGFPCGGVEAVSVNLARALARLEGMEVHVVTTDRTSAEQEITSWSGATIHRLPAGHGLLLPYAVGKGRRQIKGYLAHLRPDVVHAHDTYGVMVTGLDMPRVFTVHGFIYEDTRLGGGRFAWLRSLLWRRLETSSWAEQPHIIAITPFVRERLRGIARGRIHDIENPIDERFFEVRRVKQEPTVFCAAAICGLKNTLGLLHAFEMLLRSTPEACLRLAGPECEPAYAAEMKDFIRSEGLSDKVSLLGSISSERVREELARASLFALVSLQENAPMSIAEAMAAGVPVVTSNRCGMPHMVRDGQTGFLVNPLAPAEIAARMSTLLVDPSANAAFGVRAREAALRRFHPVSVAEKTLEVYRQCVANVQ